MSIDRTHDASAGNPRDHPRGRSEGLLSALMYHRIAEAPALHAMAPELASATPEGLERQIAGLAARRPIVPLADVVAARRGERALPRGAVTVTFDDAYRDFADDAWPVFRRLGVPVTLFVATAFPGDPDRVYWWDRLDAALASAGGHGEVRTAAGTLPLGTPGERRAAYQRLTGWVGSVPDDEAMAEIDRVVDELGAPAVGSGVLGWDRLRELHADGVTLASHSHSHALLQRVPPERAVNDVATSLATLERELGTAPPPVLAYPGGGRSPAVAKALGTAGIEVAFTTEHGVNDLSDVDWMALSRLNVGPRTTPALLRAQLHPAVVRSRALRALRQRAWGRS